MAEFRTDDDELVKNMIRNAVDGSESFARTASSSKPIHDDDASVEGTKVGKFRKWFRDAVDGMEDWRNEAQEDYEFVAGKQWSDADIAAFEETGRPAITINRIKPLINVLSGYQRLNRYDIDFLPRTGDDVNVCEVRKGMTKYILDQCDYDSQEAAAFLDAVVGGLGWFEVGYRFNEEMQDGEAYVKREDPFSVYVDPEAHKPDYSDAKYICRAKWVDKDELKLIFPEHADAIDAQYAVYDSAENQEGARADPTWYKSELQKIRLVECWYKTKEPVTIYYLADGRAVPEADIPIEYFIQGMVVGEQKVNQSMVRVCSFFDTVLLEDMPSPYRHGEFPLVPITCYAFGVGDIPAGFVRDLKDPQREINRRRIQILHILNTSGNGGGFMEEDAMSEEQKSEFERKGSIPGYFAEVRPQALTQGKIHERQMQQPPAAIIQAESQAAADLTAISGINEALMGVDIPNQSSGRAIELKQKQAITHIAPMFDNLRKAKKKIAYILWGKRGHAGIVPQYYTEDKVYRVEGANGQQFIRVNEQVVQQDPLGNAVVSTLNDLSQGEFDIVISDTQASTTQRQAQMWNLIDACGKLQVPGDLVFDIILDLSDLPSKDDIKQRWQQRQEAQQQSQERQAQAQLELERIKNENINQSIAFKDAPLPIQFAMAAKQGLIDPQIAQYAMDLMVQQMFPQLAERMAAQRQDQELQAQQQAQASMQERQLMQAMQEQMGQNQQGQSQSQPAMTQAAMQSLMAGQQPAL